MGDRQQSVSACVITYNRASIVGTCLRAVGFADEVILVDKTSTDETRAVAARFVDRIVTVPWSPTVEETRALAVSLCRHDWILLLDDDECLNPEAVRFIQRELAAPRADLYAFPLRHYILGRHDERAYYWPEHHIRLFRRDCMTLGGKVHAGLTPRSERIIHIGLDEGPCIHHLSHPDVSGWIERTNRYTSRPDRARVGDQFAAEIAARETAAANGADLTGTTVRGGLPISAAVMPVAAKQTLVDFAYARIGHWMSQTRDPADDDYLQAVALLRAVYDIVDRLKTWEEARGQDGAVLFRQVCTELDVAHAAAGTSRDIGTRPWAWLRRLLMQCRPGSRQGFVLTRPFCLHPRE